MRIALASLILVAPSLALTAPARDWVATTNIFGYPLRERLTLAIEADKVTGTLGDDGLEGTVKGGAIHFVAKDKEGGTVEVTGTLAAAAIEGYEPASVVALSPTIDDRVARLTAIREARAPKLILVGSLDGPGVEDAEAVYRGAIGHCELTRFPVAARGTGLLTGEWGSHARERVLAHITRTG